MGKGTPAKRGKKRSKKQQESIFADTDEDSDVPVRSPTVYEGERADRIAQNERVLGALVTRPLPMAEEIEAAKPTRKRCEPKRLHARSMLSTLLRCYLANSDMRERVYVRLQARHSIASWFCGQMRRRCCIRAWRL